MGVYSSKKSLSLTIGEAEKNVVYNPPLLEQKKMRMFGKIKHFISDLPPKTLILQQISPPKSLSFPFLPPPFLLSEEYRPMVAWLVFSPHFPWNWVVMNIPELSLWWFPPSHINFTSSQPASQPARVRWGAETHSAADILHRLSSSNQRWGRRAANGRGLFSREIEMFLFWSARLEFLIYQ